MRKLFLGGALIAGALLPASGAQAAYGDAPWCLNKSLGRGGAAERCEYRTFEACNADRTLSNSFCIQNPRYLPYWQGRGFDAPQAPQRVSHKSKKKHRRR
jgi:hypothetical protein